MNENERAVHQAYDALFRGDLDRFLDFIHPEVEFNSLIPEAERRTYQGHAGVHEWWAGVREFMGGIHSEIEEIHELGANAGLVKATVRGSARGVPVEQTMWQAILFDEQFRASWWHFARTEEEAREALDRRRGAAG